MPALSFLGELCNLRFWSTSSIVSSFPHAAVTRIEEFLKEIDADLPELSEDCASAGFDSNDLPTGDKACPDSEAVSFQLELSIVFSSSQLGQRIHQNGVR